MPSAPKTVNFEWFVCRRYLQAKKKQGFISLISLISVAGVTVGVMALIVVLAVMTGFTSELREKILGVNSHIVLQKRGDTISDYHDLVFWVQQHEGVVSAMPYLYTQAMITAGIGGTGAVLRGIDPETGARALSISEHMLMGSLASLAVENKDDARKRPAIILGAQLAKELHVTMGERIKLISASGPLTPLGVIPQVTVCEITGIFETGMYEYDATLAFVSLATAQDFLDIEDVAHGIEIKVKDIYRAENIAVDLTKELGSGYVAQDWMKMNRNLFSALQLEKTAMFIVQALIILVAAFNIISTLTMVVMEKTKEIAILKSMGATSGQVMRIFIYEGLVIGLAGTLVGVLGGLTICRVLSRYQFIKLPADVYPFTTLPVQVLTQDVVIIALGAVLITFMATLYPSYQAAKIDPAVALRYE